MELFSKPAAVIPGYPLRSLGNADQFLFLDIETTGLSPSTGQIYLIGTLTHTEPAGWVLRQWFADSLTAEEEMLRSFFDFASHYSTLVHYNGDSFDIPFLIRCASQYGITHPFSGMNSLDLYRIVRPYRKLLGGGRLNQKSMEKFLGIDRTDRMNGGELIDVYNTWLRTRETALREQFLLHNEEDVSNLLALLSILSYRDFFCGAFSAVRAEERNDILVIRAESRTELPAKAAGTFEDAELSAEGQLLTLTVRLRRGTLRHFFSNYRDYYFLPQENRVIHKSLAEFVDRSAKEKASARNAFVRKEGVFLPVYGPVSDGVPLFQEDFHAPTHYIEYTDACRAETFLTDYLNSFLLKAGLRGT